MNIETPIADGIHLVHIDQLYLHPMNPRQNGSDEDTRAMAGSIAINGLIQNLSGYADPARDGIGIVAGGRRLAGLKHLLSEGSGMMDSKEPPRDAIPVRVTTDAFLARSWAGSESATQKPLHPADEIAAFAAMADQGNSPETIARAFAQTIAHVRRRLALAALIPEALDALRAGHISLDAAKALTLARDPAHQLEVLTAARAGNWTADHIRRDLTASSVPSTDRRAIFVGTDAYLQAGGTIEEDLFAECSRLQDEDLLNDLFLAKLNDHAQAVKDEQGWSWAQACPDPYADWRLTEGMTRLYRTPVELPEADEQDLEELEEIGEDGLDKAGQARLHDLRMRERGDYTDEDRARGGIIVIVNRRGEPEIEGAYAEKRAKAKSDAAADAPATRKPDLTAAGVEDLNRVRLLAMQTALIEKTELVLDLFAWQLQRGAPTYASLFDISLRDSQVEPSVENGWAIDARLADGSNAYRAPDRDEDPVQSFTAFRDAGKKHRNAILTRHIIRTLQGPVMNTMALTLLPQLIDIDIRKLWTPDVPTYFSRLSAPAMELLWSELLDLDQDDDRRAEFAKLKKGEKAAELAALFSDASVQEAHGLSRDQVAAIDAWLPPEIRTQPTS